VFATTLPPSPKSTYSPADLIDNLHENVDRLSDQYPNDVFVLTGDLNQLNVSSLLVDFGLDQIVTVPTRKHNILDVFITNRPDLFSCTVARSVLTSDHFAVYINCLQSSSSNLTPAVTHQRRVKCYNRSLSDIAKLIDFFDNYNWSGFTQGVDNRTLTVDDVFTDFLTVLHHALDNVVGFKTITVRDKDPPYITPFIRIMLRSRNKLIRHGKITQANLLSKKIGKFIDRARANSLQKASASDTRQLWGLLRSSRNWSGKKHSHSSLNLSPDFCPTANDLNSYYAGVSTDPDYSSAAITEVLHLHRQTAA